VPVPYDRRLQDLYLPTQDLYLPTTLSSDEYPNMLEPGETIDTVEASVLLVSFNWPENSERYHRMANFVNVFFSKLDEFRKPPRHPKWKEASRIAVIPGWTRFKAHNKGSTIGKSSRPTRAMRLRLPTSRSSWRSTGTRTYRRKS
jgi:hypothetical protein